MMSLNFRLAFIISMLAIAMIGPVASANNILYLKSLNYYDCIAVEEFSYQARKAMHDAQVDISNNNIKLFNIIHYGDIAFLPSSVELMKSKRQREKLYRRLKRLNIAISESKEYSPEWNERQISQQVYKSVYNEAIINSVRNRYGPDILKNLPLSFPHGGPDSVPFYSTVYQSCLTAPDYK